MAIGHCINCDKEIFRRVNGRWEDIEYHSITFMESNQSYLRFAFCKKCHDEWDEVNSVELKPKIIKHIKEVIEEQMKPYLDLEIVGMITKDGPLDDEDKKNMQVVDGGLACR